MNQETPRRGTTDQQEAVIQQMATLMTQMVTTAGTRAQDFLTITNGSAAIACLAMIGSESPYARSPVVKILLATFLIGLILAGVTMMRGFAYTTVLAFDFRDAVGRLRSGDSTWDELMRLFDPIRGRRLFRTNVAIGAASLITFLVGAAGAIFWLLVLCD